MIVVTIIALLATLAIPAWQRVRLQSLLARMDNDARQLAQAAHQYFLENNLTQVDVSVGPDGQVNGALHGYVRRVSPGYTVVSSPFVMDQTFVMRHQMIGAIDVEYSSEGTRRADP